MRVRVKTDKPLVVLMVGLSGLAWLALLTWGQSPYGRYLNHHALDTVRGDGRLALVFVLGWMVMTIAMMLPTSLPLLALFSRLTRQRPDHHGLVALVALGYLLVWTLFGGLVYLADAALHGLVAQVAWLADYAWALGAGTFILAGVYQFTPLKYQCLDKCRSPWSFILEHWQGRAERLHAFWLGAQHGVFCVGCCWSLMLLMFAVGVGNLGWMMTLGLVMAVEKNMPWGRRLSKPLGVILILGGVALTVAAQST